MPSDLERAFAAYWRILARDLPPYEAEYHFAKHVILPTGKPWGVRFDFAWPDSRVAVELEGGTMQIGRHQRPKGFEDDARKYNQATIDGWKLLRFTSGMLSSNPKDCIDQIRHLLTQTA